MVSAVSAQTPHAAVMARAVFSRLLGIGPVRLPLALTLMVWPAFAGVSVGVAAVRSTCGAEQQAREVFWVRAERSAYSGISGRGSVLQED